MDIQQSIEILRNWSILPIVAAVIWLSFLDGPVNRLLGGRVAHEIPLSVVCVTGCDSGFGLYMAKKMKDLGYIVVATCLSQAGANVLEEYGVGYTVVVDLCSEEKAYSAIGDAVRNAIADNRGSKLWGLVNNAGIAPIGFTDWMPMADFRKSMEVNYFAIVGVTKELLPLLKQSAHSRIINVSSMAGKTATCSFGPYAGSKHALEGYAKALRYELRPFGIEVCNVNPGFMNTPLISTSLSLAQRAVDEAPVDVTCFYDVETVLKGNADGLLRIREPLNTVGDYIVDYLLSSKRPCFNHYVGYQASLVRWFITFPQGLQELLTNIFAPTVGVKPEQVRMTQSLGSYSPTSRIRSATPTPTPKRRSRSKSASRKR
eukprot:GSChrysophyteH1.ASY1.ANO1.2593.1 assembled CDS